MVDFNGASIFCEDVRIEASGQRTYVGVFPRRITIEEDLPFAFPPLCIASHLNISSRKAGVHPKFIVTRKTKTGEEHIIFEDSLPELPYSKEKPNNIVNAVFHSYLDEIEVGEPVLITTKLLVEDETFITGMFMINTSTKSEESQEE